ncbi:unnamed protein product [Ixodes pacificus]
MRLCHSFSIVLRVPLVRVCVLGAYQCKDQVPKASKNTRYSRGNVPCLYLPNFYYRKIVQSLIPRVHYAKELNDKFKIRVDRVYRKRWYGAVRQHVLLPLSICSVKHAFPVRTAVVRRSPLK